MIDRYAYSNRLRRVDPASKGALALAVLLICLVGNRPGVGLLATAWMFALATLLARVPARAVTRVLLAEFFFLALASLGIGAGVQRSGPLPPAGGWAIPLGPLAITSSPAMLAAACNAMLRALGATAALNFLALTTPLVDLIALLRRLRVPALLIDLMVVIYRFIFILSDTLDRIYTAQCCRLGYSSPRRSLASAACLGSRLFIDTYRRSQRLQMALDARGYNDTLGVLPATYSFSHAVLWTGLAAVTSLILLRIVL